MDSQEIREKIGRFRALIIGRPNAGKTTILKCIARSADGRVDPSSGRGIHDIEEELVFRSNPGFVFHDSPGIEAGATNEMQAIQDFISKRATARSLSEKLHAIWYCIPTDNTRLVAAAELQFFDQIDPNGVPVILIFTKFESQEAVVFAKLQKTYSLDDALARAPQQARQEFEQDHLSRFKNRKYPPKEIIYLKNMDKGDAECSEIIELTTRALNNDTLKWLLATVQEVNLKFRVEQMLRSKFLFKHFMTNERIHMEKKTYMKLARAVWIWFPHLWQLNDFDYYDDDRRVFNDEETITVISPLISRRFPWSNPLPLFPSAPNINNDFLRALYLVASLVITAENSFWLRNTPFPLNVKQAVKSYLKSSASHSVSNQIQTAFQAQFSEFPDITQRSQIAVPFSQIINDNLLSHSSLTA